MSIAVLKGDCRDVLKTLPDESVHCVVTSPPYWGLRDYGVDGQIGLEPDFNTYIATMVEVFREVRRVLRKDGTLWLNLGDSYASSVNGRKAADIVDDDRTFRDKPFNTAIPGLFKPKDLCGIPWRVAFALQADGWWLRSDIIWAKKNPMPESVTDRPTKSHEYLFLLAKSERYYFDQESVRDAMSEMPEVSPGVGVLSPQEGRHRSELQGMCESSRQRVASSGRGGQREKGSGSLFKDGEWTGKASGLWPEPSAVGLYGGVSSKPEWQGGGQKGVCVDSREGATEEIFPGAARQSRDGQKEGETSRADGNQCDADGRGVGDDTGKSERSLRLLQNDQDSNDGPYRSAEPWGLPYEGKRDPGMQELQFSEEGSVAGRNIRSVWHIATSPFSQAHFATFPPALIEPCIKAGTSEKGCCVKCGAPLVRQTEVSYENRRPSGSGRAISFGGDGRSKTLPLKRKITNEVGWSPSCSCEAATVPCTVLDPFGGAGTTGLVADRLQRNAVLVELNPEYAAMAESRVRSDAGMFADMAPSPALPRNPEPPQSDWDAMWSRKFDYPEQI
jgi:DNA modification methylase